MKVRDILPLLDAGAVTGEAALDREIRAGYVCDVLSRALARGRRDVAWVTVQSSMNMVAVAAFHAMSCVIVAEGEEVGRDVAARAAEEGIAILTTRAAAYEVVEKLSAAGIGSMN